MLISAAVNRYAFLCKGYRNIGGMSVRISHGNLRIEGECIGHQRRDSEA